MAKEITIRFRATETEQTAYKGTAEAMNMAVSEWIRDTLCVATVSYRNMQLISVATTKKTKRKEKPLKSVATKRFTTRLKGQWEPA